MTDAKITSSTVRDDFNSIEAVLHYTRAAVSLGLWESERILVERFFTDRNAPLLEAGCGAGRATLGLWALGYRNITAFDFADELLEQAVSLARERRAETIRFVFADATHPDLCHLLGDKATLASNLDSRAAVPTHDSLISDTCHLLGDKCSAGTSVRDGAMVSQVTQAIALNQRVLEDPLSLRCPGIETDSRPNSPAFAGALFLFNGLMQIPGRENRRAAMRELHRACRADAPLIFTTHDRDDCREESELWARERAAWGTGRQDPRLVEFGDRYMESTEGRIFMHLPDQAEIREDLAATGWELEFTAMRREIAREPRAVRAFSDECRFWVAKRMRASR